MKKAMLLITSLLLLTGCAVTGAEKDSVQESTAKTTDFQRITAQAAKDMMDKHSDALILDVREQNEFDSAHIPGAVLLPVGSINEASAAAVIPNKETIVLVYCRSGNRSKTASKALVELGYTQIYEFGGIIDWPYDVE